VLLRAHAIGHAAAAPPSILMNCRNFRLQSGDHFGGFRAARPTATCSLLSAFVILNAHTFPGSLGANITPAPTGHLRARDKSHTAILQRVPFGEVSNSGLIYVH
jgi:hypothetical protein